MTSETPAEFTLELIREHLYTAVICDALDSLGFRNQSPRVTLSNLTTTQALVGRCKTTLWSDMFHDDPSPYELELQAVDGCRDGDVLIAAAGGSMRSGIWGELLTTAAKNRGCRGAIIDGAVRDVAKIEAMDFPVFARGTCIYDSQNRQRVIDLDVKVQIDGVEFAPGNLVMADRDGVVVIPQTVEQDTLKRAWEKVHAENITRDAIRSGMKAADAYKKYGVL
ncbi:MAG TPA: RraA family protein [Planctomycetaceae bacterium]|nr:RraA family protein [Planctomycetaceae bacterium]